MTQELMVDDDASMLATLAACYFRDIASLAKSHPQRQRSSVLATEGTRHLLREEFARLPTGKIEAACHAITAHSFNAQVAPLTTEAETIQDVDRLEALGVISLACTFATPGALDLALFDGEDSFTQYHTPDNKRYALDYFQIKLLKLP